MLFSSHYQYGGPIGNACACLHAIINEERNKNRLPICAKFHNLCTTEHHSPLDRLFLSLCLSAAISLCRLRWLANVAVFIPAQSHSARRIVAHDFPSPHAGLLTIHKKTRTPPDVESSWGLRNMHAIALERHGWLISADQVWMAAVGGGAVERAISFS